jgi:hypothetical protein
LNLTQITNFVDKEWMHMIKQLAWNTFKNTGNIDTFMELMALQSLEKNINVNENIKVNEYGDNKDQGFDTIRE